jgi:DNA-binding SARP family transcriptional activator
MVAGRLWPEMTQHRALANVRRALWRLPEPGGRPLVAETAGGLTLATDIDVDTHGRRLVVARLERGLLCSEDEIDDLRSELLPDWPDEWVYHERERCRQDGLHGLDAAAVVAAGQREFALATRIGLTAVELDPLRESSHRALMRVHLMEGNLVDVRRRYDAYLALLVASGLEPVVSDETRELVAHLLPTHARAGATPARRRTDAGYLGRAAGLV